jgi:HAE1 family hydrophobic/amphiphilic exporter-1
MIKRCCAGLFVITLLSAGPDTPALVLRAQQAPATDPAVVLPPRIGVAAGPPVSLTLEDAIRMTLEQNNDVTIARLEADAAKQDVYAAEGVFDPKLLPFLSYQRTVSASASAIGGAREGRIEQNLAAGTLGLDGRAPWAGGRFTLDFTSSKIESSNQFARLNPQFPSALAATYIQPLARGRTIDAERRQILLARRTADLTGSQLTRVLMDQITLVEQAYWDLAFAVRNLDVQAGALAQAQSQVQSNERQVRGGTLAPIDVVEAQTQVANFRQTVASAQQALTEAENRLKSLVLGSRQAAEWNKPIMPIEATDRPTPSLSLEEAVTLALTRRPELASLDTARAQNEIDRQYFQNQARPQMDLVGAYSLSGLAGSSLGSVDSPIGGDGSDAAVLARLNELSAVVGLTPLPVPPPSSGSSVPPFLVGGYGDSLGNLLGRRYPTASLQLQMELPLANTTARANLARTRIEATQLARQRQQLEQVIEAEVRNALQAVQSSQDRFDAASAARRSAQEQYDSERRRFESGLSTVFLVLERQTDLVVAQARELRARADLNQASALLDRAVGSTLERYGVSIVD